MKITWLALALMALTAVTAETFAQNQTYTYKN